MNKKIKLLVEVDESDYEAVKNDGVQNHIALADEIIRNGTPILGGCSGCNSHESCLECDKVKTTEGDMISRQELLDNIQKVIEDNTENLYPGKVEVDDYGIKEIIDVGDNGIATARLLMTKEAFVEAYNKYIVSDDSKNTSEWVLNDMTGILDCKKCGMQAPIDITSGEFAHSPYCPWCGAKMQTKE